MLLPVATVNIEEQDENSEGITGHVRTAKQPGQASCPVLPSGNLKHEQMQSYSRRITTYTYFNEVQRLVLYYQERLEGNYNISYHFFTFLQ